MMEYSVGVIGLGFVGLSHAVSLASAGYRVIGVDIDREKLGAIERGMPPFKEPGIDEVLRNTIGRSLIVSSRYEDLKEANIVFIAVNAPTTDKGQDLSQLESALDGLARAWRGLNDYRLVAIKSTVLPGTTRSLYKRFKMLSNMPRVGFASNPEFLREGRALEDIRNPSRVVIGGVDAESSEVLSGFWRDYYKRVGVDPPILVVEAEEAEMIKYASNVFLAMRVSFANTIARICEETPRCDALNVLYGAGLDPRIGVDYLKPGPGYGGSCLPKDTRALIHYADMHSIPVPLIRAVEETNRIQLERIIAILEEELGGIEGRVITILGAAFKAGTDDVRESRSIYLARELIRRGARVRLHDPLALDNARRLLGDIVEYHRDIDSALRSSDAVVIMTEWHHYKNIDWSKLKPGTLVVDYRRVTDPVSLEKMGIRVRAVGLSRKK